MKKLCGVFLLILLGALFFVGICYTEEQIADRAHAQEVPSAKVEKTTEDLPKVIEEKKLKQAVTQEKLNLHKARYYRVIKHD